jgi:hypothetical protein
MTAMRASAWVADRHHRSWQAVEKDYGVHQSDEVDFERTRTRCSGLPLVHLVAAQRQVSVRVGVLARLRLAVLAKA